MIAVVAIVAVGIGAVLWRKASRGPEITMTPGWWLLPMTMVGFVMWWLVALIVF